MLTDAWRVYIVALVVVWKSLMLLWLIFNFEFWDLLFRNCLLFSNIFANQELSPLSDIDECSIQGVAECHTEAYCNNTDGSYECTCGVGYAGDGYNCSGKKPYNVSAKPCLTNS